MSASRKKSQTKNPGRVEDNPVYVPMDRQTAIVTGKGVHFEPDMKNFRMDNTFDLPPQMRPVPKYYKFNLVGVRFGKFIVIGLYVFSNYRHKNRLISNESRAKWVCKCACGKYELRLTKSVRNPSQDHVPECAYCIKIRSICRNKTKSLRGAKGKGNERND
jgi:hypothetical protein